MGAGSMLAIGVLVSAVAAAVWLFIAADEPPGPTAARQDVVGTVIRTEPRLCVEEMPVDTDQAEPEVWCGIAEVGTAPDVAVGDVVSGSLIDVEIDPGSGSAFGFWETLSSSEG